MERDQTSLVSQPTLSGTVGSSISHHHKFMVIMQAQILKIYEEVSFGLCVESRKSVLSGG
jgi:hypothetical protein